MNEALFKEILQLTEEMEDLLKADSFELIVPVLARRKEAIERLEDDPSLTEQEAVFWLKKIKVAEARCATLAEVRKKKIGDDLLAMQNGKRALHAYGRQG